ncbi:MAG TPA: molybdopterin-dependent oxidoreductase [Candidatus Limnocylindria bacterium]|nr:molybdopterin-dependent oxidoreductase [Candidatus Limnocylindria bacterium]
MKRLLPVLLVLSLLLALPFQAARAADAVSAATAARYRESEVREYEGARLDPAVGPRDNSIKGIQQVDIEDFRLTVGGLTDKEVVLTYDEVRAMEPQERLITLYCVEGWDATVLWRGVLLKDLMDLAGVKPEAVTVIFSAVDGYTTSIPLSEVLERELILAWGANGLDLPPSMGYPFIVVAQDKWGYKWARWVSGITLSDDANYLGFWEKLGYPNDADLMP